MHLLLFVLQEESNVKPEEQEPRSRIGPRNEDLTIASKQVRNPCKIWHVRATLVLKKRLFLI